MYAELVFPPYGYKKAQLLRYPHDVDLTDNQLSIHNKLSYNDVYGEVLNTHFLSINMFSSDFLAPMCFY